MSGLQTAVVLFLIPQWKGPCALFVINLHVNMYIAKRLVQKNWAAVCDKNGSVQLKSFRKTYSSSREMFLKKQETWGDHALL